MNSTSVNRLRFGMAAALLFAAPAVRARAQTALLLPLKRTAYQTNESIHLAVVRSAPKALPAGDLTLTVTGRDGSRMTFALSVGAVPVVGKDARTTEHVYLNARLLRPGRYTIEAAVDGATAAAELELYSHLRRSAFKLINWGRARGKDQLVEGEDSLGFNLFYGHYAADEEANFIRAGVDFIRCCTMGGGHQMDLRAECDWSDPYVSRGGAVRVVRQALAERTRGNVLGVHFYDEPGLTHLKHPVTGEHTPHGIPSQVRSYRSAFGREPPPYHKVDPNNPRHVARWAHWARWKLGFMNAAWKLAQWGVSYVRPDFLSTTQSQYGWSAFTDGYYFNVVRCLPVTSGHGGYHDYGLDQFNPSFFLEMARARDLGKPCWYLPTWYGNTTAEQFRLEQYLCFQTGIQGLMTPPDIDPYQPSKKPAAQGVVESNKLAARLGTIFTTMPPTRPPVAMLYSLSHLIHKQTLDRTVNYAHGDRHGRNLPLVYLAGKTIQQPFLPIVEEDVLDGTLAAGHKAVILTGIDHLDGEVVSALETFAADGGLVLLTGDCTVNIKGAVNLAVTPKLPDQAVVDRLLAEKKYGELPPYTKLAKQFEGAKPLADAIRAELAKAKIRPVFACDNRAIVATRQAAGDIEYLFAVNAAIDPAGPRLNTAAATATIDLPADGRPVYDAVLGRPTAQFKKAGGQLRGAFRFGPGQMRVFARTRRPIGAVKALTPVLRRDYTNTDAPLSVETGAVLLAADGGGVLSGSAPLRIRLIDPLDKARCDLYRATRLGMLRLSLPLAANDPAGQWTVSVRELLSGTQSSVTFGYRPARRCGAMAGLKRRAVCFGRDRDNIFRFFRVHRSVTIVQGTGDYNTAAARRLAEILKPWDVQCTIVQAADVNRPRQIPDEAAKTWVGLQFGRVNPKKPAIGHVGFDLAGPVILLGTGEDNPLIAHLLKHGFLPYAPKAGEFPGRGRGLLAWQRDAVGHGQESVTVIAHDAEGMHEAVGTLYEALAGIEPVRPLVIPTATHLTPARRADVAPQLKIAWQVSLPDRAVAMKPDGRGLIVLSRDESLSAVSADGKAAPAKPLTPQEYRRKADEMKPTPDAAAQKAARAHPVPGRIVKFASSRGQIVAIGYWGGLVRVIGGDGKVTGARQFAHDVSGLAWMGETLVVGLSDGRVLGLGG